MFNCIAAGDSCNYDTIVPAPGEEPLKQSINYMYVSFPGQLCQYAHTRIHAQLVASLRVPVHLRAAKDINKSAQSHARPTDERPTATLPMLYSS